MPPRRFPSSETNSALSIITNGQGDAGKLFVSAPTLLIDGRGTAGGYTLLPSQRAMEATSTCRWGS